MLHAAEAPRSPERQKRSAASRIATNFLMGIGRIAANAIIALLLPAYLTKHLTHDTYAAWVLIIQLSAYVGFLDFGVQTAISAAVAKFDGRGDLAGANAVANAGFRILLVGSCAGVGLTAFLAWRVPEVFSRMPASLYPEVRNSVVVLGISLAYTLLSSAYSAVFIGLQQFRIPTLLTVANRTAASIVILSVVACHRNLLAMAIGVAAINIVTSSIQIALCKRLVPTIQVATFIANPSTAREVLRDCISIALISGTMLCINSLDLVIVGRYDFARTGYYSIAASPNTLLLTLLSAAMGAFLPAASALRSHKVPDDMGHLLLRVTRYCSLPLVLMGMVLLIFGPWLLRLWVGTQYAENALPILQILVVANIVRNLYAPYATMLVALNKQSILLFSSLAEATVNLASSIYFAVHYGAIGVAWGTLLGALVGVATHLTLSVRLSSAILPVTRKEMLFSTVIRPAVVACPLVAIYAMNRAHGQNGNGHPTSLGLLCILISLGIGIFWVLNDQERIWFRKAFRNLQSFASLTSAKSTLTGSL